MSVVEAFTTAGKGILELHHTSLQLLCVFYSRTHMRMFGGHISPKVQTDM